MQTINNGLNYKNVYFILVEPQTAGNIGSACRAIKTMGFSQIYCVNPSADIHSPEAHWMTHGAEDVLQDIKIFPNIQAAIAEMNWTIGTTNRKRGLNLPYMTAEELGQKTMEFNKENKIGILFGREKTGLTNEELYYCNAITYIPAHRSHPSLNLSQAVQIVAYELYKSCYGAQKEFKHKLASQEQVHHLYENLKRVLKKVEFIPKDNMETFIMRFQRWFGRSHPEVRDVKVLHMIFKSIENYVDILKKKIDDLESSN